MSPLVSVIIPVYNTSAYIARCCHSLFAQTLGDMEFVFVDDGSTDDSLQVIHSIVSQYPDRMAQVQILTQLHQGVSAARQLGMYRATGQYVIHCDSDDWVDITTYEQLYKHAIATHADIVTFGYLVEDEAGNKLNTTHALVAKSQISFSIGPDVGSLCLKLIRKDFILQHHLHLPQNINWGEDLCLSLQSLLLSSNTQSLDLPFYHYGQHHGSITHTIDRQRCNELVQCGIVIEQFLHEHQLSDRYADQLLWLKFQLKQYFLIFPQVRDLRQWTMVFPESHVHIMSYPCSLYIRHAAWLVSHRLSLLALLLLRLRDFISSIKQS